MPRSPACPLMDDDSTAAVLQAPDARNHRSGVAPAQAGDANALKADQGPTASPHLDAPTRPLAKSDELLNQRHPRSGSRGGRKLLPPVPARPLLFTTFSTAERILRRSGVG